MAAGHAAMVDAQVDRCTAQAGLVAGHAAMTGMVAGHGAMRYARADLCDVHAGLVAGHAEVVDEPADLCGTLDLLNPTEWQQQVLAMHHVLHQYW